MVEPEKNEENAVTVESATDNQDITRAEEEDASDAKDAHQDHLFQITVKLPHKPYEIPITVSSSEQVQDLRQTIIEQPDTFQYSCFHLEHEGTRINDFVELSEVKELKADSVIRLVEDPYTEKDARQHTIRVRDLIGAAADRPDTINGLCAGISLHDSITAPYFEATQQNGTSGNPPPNPAVGYEFEAPPSVQTLLLPKEEPAPKTVKAISVSPWNPPPQSLRMKGHLLYLQLTTLEGEQFQITGQDTGFFVNKSSNSKFDPFPRTAPKGASAHSLLTLISKLSPSFDSNFRLLQEYNSRRDPLINFQFTNALPSNPWLVSPSDAALSAHQPDFTRPQESYLISGLENAETLRDWNEELQGAKELPSKNIQDRVFRERYLSRTFADYTDSAVRGAVLVARGEIAPLNPTESRDAQIFISNNVFYSFGADGAEIFTSEGGDAAARVAVGKDVAGVKLVNQLDVEGLHTPGTVIVDYLGKRIVCQSIVPGIFKQREPGEHQVDYGGVEGRDIVADNEAFVPAFSKLSKALHVKQHSVWDKEGKKHTLEGSVETKGLLGTDGRKYVLDLYRLTPPDVKWLEDYWRDVPAGEEKPKDADYPHRMAVLRPELVELYWRTQLYVHNAKHVETLAKEKKELESKAEEKKEVETETKPETETKTNGETEAEGNPQASSIPSFNLSFNPDVYSGQVPQTEDEKKELMEDEEKVRTLCDYLRNTVIPEFIKDLQEGDVGFPMDGGSLAKLMHKRGINVRYLGLVAKLAKSQSSRLDALHALAIQEMIGRAFKHVSSRYLRNLPAPFATSAIAHLLNCLLGTGLNSTPKVELDEDIQSFYPEADWSCASITPDSLAAEIEKEVRLRYRHDLEGNWVSSIKHLQLLREISLKLGLQLVAKDYKFSSEAASAPLPTTNGTNGTSHGKKKKKLDDQAQANGSSDSLHTKEVHTFEVNDIVNLLPVVKDSCPKSTLADEALEAGRISIAQDQKELGMELLLESLSLHEQIYGLIHPEVARVYHQLAMLYYNLEQKEAAVELARKAVIVSERTLGLDCNETILSYLNLGLFEHGVGNTSLALAYIKHALDLWKLIYGLRHPDSITTINNAAVMLQGLKLFHDSRLWFEKSLEICEGVSGKDSTNTATLSFQLAQALALDAEPKAAVTRMKDAYNIFLSQLGPDDRNTKESETWLDTLTQNAVTIAKHAKDLQARRSRNITMKPRVTMGTKPQPQVGQSSAEAANGQRDRATSATQLDQRSVDELIKFIEGGGESARSPKKRTRGNPKRRAGASRPTTAVS